MLLDRPDSNTPRKPVYAVSLQAFKLNTTRSSNIERLKHFCKIADKDGAEIADAVLAGRPVLIGPLVSKELMLALVDNLVDQGMQAVPVYGAN